MNKITPFISGLLVVAAFSACTQSGSNKESAHTDSVKVQTTEKPADLKDENTQQVYNDYLKLKDVLVASDAAAAQSAGKELAVSLAKIEGCENTSSIATKISASKDLKEQRVQFTALSSDIIALMKHTDINSGKLFVQHCPMANDGEGGYWLSSESEIRNPYYGDEMLNCGSVKETISAK